MVSPSAALPPIVLDRHWQISTGDGAAWFPLAALPDYAHDRLPLRLRCLVYLQPTEVCVRYMLRLDSAPAGTLVSVNGWNVGTVTGETFQVNVTDQVTLEDNVIELEVRAAGNLRGAMLQPVPCG